LNTRELAGLWHLPQAADDVPFVERTTARRRLPLPATVAIAPGGEGCMIGRSEHQGHSVAVALPGELLRRHLLAIAKTRRGKSSLMLRLVNHLMLSGTSGPGGRAAGSSKRCVILVDPHSDLATAALGLVPPERHEDVVYLDIANRKRPFGVNLLDVGLGWDRDQAVGNALRVFRREFDAFWGRQEIINPVQTKVHKYAGSKVARAIVGQPRSTIDFRELIARDRIVIINLHAFDVIEDTAALIGGTLLNLAARAVSSQSSLPPDQRRSVTMAVDEFHTIPGADYEQVFGELAKYGANMILATQTLSRLDRLTEGDRTRDLRAAVFSNLDGLFAFHTSAEDAEYLAEELGGGLDKQDILELGHYQTYARLTDVRTGERLPSFSVRLDAPPVADSAVAAQLARESARRYGRESVDVELDLQAAAERIHGPRSQARADEPYPAPTEPDPKGAGAVSASRASLGAHVPRPARSHGEGKRRRKQVNAAARESAAASEESPEQGEAPAA
jgi:hypothetical protein